MKLTPLSSSARDGDGADCTIKELFACTGLADVFIVCLQSMAPCDGTLRETHLDVRVELRILAQAWALFSSAFNRPLSSFSTLMNIQSIGAPLGPRFMREHKNAAAFDNRTSCVLVFVHRYRTWNWHILPLDTPHHVFILYHILAAVRPSLLQRYLSSVHRVRYGEVGDGADLTQRCSHRSHRSQEATYHKTNSSVTAFAHSAMQSASST